MNFAVCGPIFTFNIVVYTCTHYLSVAVNWYPDNNRQHSGKKLKQFGFAITPYLNEKAGGSSPLEYSLASKPVVTEEEDLVQPGVSMAILVNL